MSGNQRRAWLEIVVGVACVVAYIALLPFVGPLRACAAFGLFGVTGFGPLLGRRDLTDERIKAISRRATAIGFKACCLVFMAASMCVWAVSQFALAREQIPVVILPQITYLAAIAFIIGHGIATLVLYGRETEAGNV